MFETASSHDPARIDTAIVDTPPMLEQHFAGPIAWIRDTPLPDNGIVTIDAECQREIAEAVTCLRANPLPIVALAPEDFEMPACRELMRGVRSTLDEGHGFVILDHLDVDSLEQQEAKALHWLLMSLLGRPVAQKWDGTLVYDVLDTGRAEGVGAGVRGSKTNGRQGYHTDNSYNRPPEYVGLLCLRTAMEGGVSGLVSFYSAHNRLLEEHPRALARLYRPFLFERYDEFAPGENPISEKPIFAWRDGRLSVCLSTNRVRIGYQAAGVTMDEETNAALAALDEVLEAPDLGKTFEFDRGQIQIVNNAKLGHRRTAFRDWPELDRRRHLVRIWIRNQGRRFYSG